MAACPYDIQLVMKATCAAWVDSVSHNLEICLPTFQRFLTEQRVEIYIFTQRRKKDP